MAISLLINPQKPPLLSHQPRSRDPNAWLSALKRHAKLKNDRAILASYAQMEALGVPPCAAALPLVLKACAKLYDAELGKKVHLHICGTDLVDDVRVRTALIDFYCKCGLMDDARELFVGMSERDLISWNAMIGGYVRNGGYEDAVSLFYRMRREGLRPSSVTLVSLLSAFAELSQLRPGREIHCYCLRNGLFDSEAHVGTSLIGFYSRFNVRSSLSVFKSMTMRNAVSWNAMIYGYLNAGDVSEALNLFIQMLVSGVVPDSVTLLAVLQSCAEFERLDIGEQVHQFVIKYGFSCDRFIGSALIDLYGRCGSLDSACEVFERIHPRDLVSWNAMLSACKNCGDYDKASDIYKRMRLEGIKEGIITIATMLLICAQSGEIEKAEQLHAYVIKTGSETDFAIESALLSVYVEFNRMASCHEIFDKMDRTDVVSWNAMIKGLIHDGLTCEAWLIFRDMLLTRTKPNSFTMVALLAGCKEQSFLNVGRSVHGYIIRHGLQVNSSLCTALTEMYMDCGYEPAAVYLFWSSSERDVVSWNAMTASYVRNGRPDEALRLFYKMQLEEKPNSTTMLIVLPACALMACLPQGRCLHGYIMRSELFSDFDVSLENSLLMMYAKCGSINNAEKIFDNLQKREIISWNAMIAAYGMHGRGEDALCIFYQMLEAGIRPTGVTFVSVLSACSHSGLIEKGLELFHSMKGHYSITPDVVHYSCMVDMLGRAGRLDEACDFIHSMTVEPDASIWRALLAACREGSNTELARMAAENLVELEPMNIGNYILLSNIYAAAGSWEDVKKLRKKIKEKGLRKPPGNSWLSIRNHVQCFTVGNASVPPFDLTLEKMNFSLVY